jgi:hypothetical protein
MTKAVRTRFLALALTTTAAAALVAVTVSVNAARQPKDQFKKRDRTTEHQRRMTEKQRGHAKAFGRFKGDKRLLDEGVSVSEHDMFVGSPEGESENAPFERVQALKCSTDGSFIGLVRGATSLPTEDGTFLFTDYVLEVQHAFRAPAARPLVAGALVTVSRPGGTVHLENRSITASSNMFPPLDIGGRYLMFVSYQPETKDFLSNDTDWAYRLQRGRIIDAREVKGVREAETAGQKQDQIESALIAKVCK